MKSSVEITVSKEDFEKILPLTESFSSDRL